MIFKKNLSFILLWFVLLLFPCGAIAADSSIVTAALQEGNLYIYGSIDRQSAAELVKEFALLYPGIKVDYVEMTAADVFSRHMRDLAARRVSADILWNSDITLQAALVRDGYTLPYRPERRSSIMPLAYLEGSAFVTGFEPVVLAYNKKLLAAKELPVTRKLLLKKLELAEWRGKLGSCDPEKSDLAYLFLTQDLAYGQNFWGMVVKLGAAGLKLYPDYQTLLDRISTGEVMAGYNLPLSAVLQRAATDASIGWLYPADYTLVLPQSALITRVATNPNAARLWIDFLLSAQAQQIIAESSNLFPVVESVAGGAMKKLGGQLPAQPALKVIGTGTEVSRFGDSGLKKGFLLRWKQKLKLVK